MATPDEHMDAARKRLVHLAGLRHRTDKAEQAIAAAATKELSRLGQGLPKLARRVHLDPAAADAYQRGVLDRGRLHLVVANAEARAAR